MTASDVRAAPPESFLATAAAIVDSDPVIGIFAACEWAELGEDGKVWIAAIVREAVARGIESTTAAQPGPAGRVAEMRRWIAQETGIAEARITGAGQDRPAVRARDALVWGARIIAGLSAAKVGRLIDRDASTVVIAQQRAETLRHHDHDFWWLTIRLNERFAKGEQA